VLAVAPVVLELVLDHQAVEHLLNQQLQLVLDQTQLLLELEQLEGQIYQDLMVHPLYFLQ
jgi:hypothetical protein